MLQIPLSFVEQTFYEIDNCNTLADLSAVIEQMRDVYGLANVVYYAIRVPSVQLSNKMLLSTYDEAWIRRYEERKYFEIDPVVLSGAKMFLPLKWSEVDHGSVDASLFFAEANSYGVGTQGVTIPIRGLAGEKALFTVTSNARKRDWERCNIRFMHDFLSIAHFVHDRVATIGGWREGGNVRDLSRRERQCLQLVARGMQPKAAADALQLSESAVHLYLKSARRKLSCLTINQAIAKSVELELIDM